MVYQKKLGRQTVALSNPPAVLGAACVVGKKEGEGPLAQTFDVICTDTTCGEKSWEKAESRMQKDALLHAMAKAGVAQQTLDYVFAGDLLNQCIGTTFGLREFNVPFFGLYGACSTMAESLSLAAMTLDGGFASCAAALTSSHFCSAERQYRVPLEYGGQRAPSAQWTATAAGAVVLGQNGPGPFVTHVTTGKLVDAGIKDAANMGAAMAPAAYETICAFFADTGQKPEDLDLIVTGDLGRCGADILRDLFKRDGIEFGARYNDCGLMLFDLKKQDVQAGGSGCGCSAAVLCGHILNLMRAGVWRSVLFCGTGALLSPVSTAQGESIPSICHAVRLNVDRGA